MRLSSPWPRERIGVPQRGHGRPDLPVDGALSARAIERGAHQPRGLAEHALELLVGDAVEPQPRRELRVPERLRLPDVPDPRDEALVEQRVAELAGLVLAPQVRDHAGEVERLGEDVRPEAARAALGELEHRPVPEHRLALGAGEHEPGLAVQLGAALDAPASGRSCAGGCGARARPRSSAAGSCRPPRPTRACVRRAGRPRGPRPRAGAASRPPSARRPAPAACAQRGGGSRLRARVEV